MELRIVIFLGLVAVAMIGNAVLMVFAFKKLADLTSKMTQTVYRFRNSEAQAWIGSLESAAERAVRITDATKIKLESFDQALKRTEDSYRRTLAEADLKTARVAADLDTAAETMRDVIAKPASSVAGVVGDLIRLAGRAV
jgi:Sec-independent protein translocase protein TatA